MAQVRRPAPAHPFSRARWIFCQDIGQDNDDRHQSRVTPCFRPSSSYSKLVVVAPPTRSISMPKATLTLQPLDADDEVDLGIPSAYTVSTASSRPSLSFAFDLPPTPSTPSGHRSSMFSPSSPDLNKLRATGRPSLSRSQTLPRMDFTRRARKNRLSIDVDDDVLDNIRRWILGIAIGGNSASCPVF